MKRIVFLLVVLFLASSSFCLFNGFEWQIQENEYNIHFSTRGAHGSIYGLKGAVIFDPAHLQESKFDVTVDVNTLNTGSNLKNKHAKARDFFDVEHFPEIHFISDSIHHLGKDWLTAGKLTIKDVTKDLSIPFVFDTTGGKHVFRGNFEINRNDFHLEKKGIGEIVKIELVVPVKRSEKQ